MNRRYFTPLLLFAFLFSLFSASAQESTADIYAKAKKFMSQGTLDSAEYYLDKALLLAPGQLDMLEDQVYLQVLKRDFAKAMQLAKPLAARPDAGIKTFQVIGMVYKEIADYKAGKKLYEQALAKFPNSGLLYAEFGDMYAGMNKKPEAIKIWEKGIEMDPGHSGNYYYATLYYAANNNPLWAVLYGENFVNIESLSNRTAEIKGLVTDLYKRISTPGFLNSRNNPFAFAVAGTFSRQPSVNMNNVNVTILTSMRMGFIKDWYQQNNSKFPYHLFGYHDQLIKEGLFEAYNQWLFGASLNLDAYNAWIEANKEKMAAFRKFTGGRVYKIPAGQYYQSKP
jgi:tetratricopeptide (TPR) repeat protein